MISILTLLSSPACQSGTSSCLFVWHSGQSPDPVFQALNELGHFWLVTTSPSLCTLGLSFLPHSPLFALWLVLHLQLCTSVHYSLGDYFLNIVIFFLVLPLTPFYVSLECSLVTGLQGRENKCNFVF